MLGRAKLKVSRRYAYRDLLRRYRIVVDGKTAAVIRVGRTKEVLVAPGEHVVQIRLDRGGSPPVDLSLDAEETVKFRCGPGAWSDLPNRDQWIELERTA